MLLIGSAAFQGSKGDFRDIDLIGTFAELSTLTKELRSSGCKLLSFPLKKNKTVLRCMCGLARTRDSHDTQKPIEVEIAWPGSTGAELLESMDTRSKFWTSASLSFRSVHVATLDVLYTIKMSHRYLKNSTHFLKTMADIKRMRALNAKIWDEDWYKRRKKETYSYAHPNLNVKKDAFFKGDGVKYIYDHDDIHRVMAIEDRPAYTYYAKEGEEVKSDRDKFFSLPEKTRLFGVLEEAYVLALERSQIPHGHRPGIDLPKIFYMKTIHIGADLQIPAGVVEVPREPDWPTPHWSFLKALEKVCTSITSGWFREFAWENYDRVAELYDPDYALRFWKAVFDGRVKKVESNQ